MSGFKQDRKEAINRFFEQHPEKANRAKRTQLRINKSKQPKGTTPQPSIGELRIVAYVRSRIGGVE